MLSNWLLLDMDVELAKCDTTGIKYKLVIYCAFSRISRLYVECTIKQVVDSGSSW